MDGGPVGAFTTIPDATSGFDLIRGVAYSPSVTSWRIVDPAAANSPFRGFASDPVLADTGEFSFRSTDISYPHHNTYISVERIYRHQTSNGRGGADFGEYFHTNLYCEVNESNGSLNAEVEIGFGAPIAFSRSSTSDPFVAAAGWERYRLYRDTVGSDFQYRLVDRNGYTYKFGVGSTTPQPLIETSTRFGQGETYEYDTSGYLVTVKVASATVLTITRNTAHAITEIEDDGGRKVKYTYDTSTPARLIKVEDACGSCSPTTTVEYLYDTSDRIESIKDAKANVIRTINYTTSTDQVESYSDALSRTYSFDYGTPIQVTDPEGNTTAYTIDGNGDVTEVTYGYGKTPTVTFEYTYDSSHRVTQIDNPDGSVVEFTYDARGNMTQQDVTANSTTITVFQASFDSDHGQIREFTNAMNETTEFFYTSGALTSMVYPDDHYATRTNNAMGLPLTVSHYEEAGATDVLLLKTAFEYNSKGHRTKTVVNPDNSTEKLEKSFTVNSIGLQEEIVEPKYVGTSTLTERVYHAKTLQLVEEIDPTGIRTLFDFDENGRSTGKRMVDGSSATLAQWVTEYNDAGYVTEQTVPGDLTTTYDYYDDGRLWKSTDAAGVVTERVYDHLGRLTEVKSGNGTTMTTRQSATYDSMGRVLTATDGESHTTTFQYDGFGRRDKVTDALGDYTTFTHDAMGRVTATKRYSSTNTLLTHSTTEYDNRGNIQKTIVKANPGGAASNDDAVTEMTYDAMGRLLTRKVWLDATNSITTSQTYDAAGRVITMTDGDGKVTTYGYDKNGNRTSVTDPRSKVTTLEYDAANRLTKTIDPLGNYSVISYDADLGLKTRDVFYKENGTTDVALSKTTYLYNAAMQQTVTRRWSDPTATTGNDSLDHVTTSTYSSTTGRLTSRTGPDGDVTTYEYDIHGRLKKTLLPDTSYTEHLFDADGHVTRTTRVEKVGTSTFTYRTDYGIDELGRVETITDQGADGTFGNTDDKTVTSEYDPVGRLVKVTDRAGRETTTTYNTLSRKTRVVEDSGSGGIGRVTDFTYDRSGRLTKLTAYVDGTSGPQDTIYSYNGRGLQTIVTYEETGDVLMTYDNAGNMTAREDEAGVIVNYTYSDKNQLVERRKNGTTSDVERYEYDALGRLAVAEKGTDADHDAVSRSEFTYDALSRVTREEQSILGGSSKTIAYTYDKAGRRTGMTLHDGTIDVTFGYDDRDRCIDIDLEGTQLAAYTWLGHQLKTRDTTCDYPGSTKPVFRMNNLFDGLGRNYRIEVNHVTPDMDRSAEAKRLGTFLYSFDDAGNPGYAQNTAGMGKLESDQWYSYDTLNRLVSADLLDTQDWNNPSSVTSTWAYDDVGNRTSSTHRGGSSVSYTHDDANRMTAVGAGSQTYDDAGNLTHTAAIYAGSAYTLVYDHHNRLTEVKDNAGTTRKAKFTWDALGRRIEYIDDTNSTTTRYYYDGVNEVYEYDGSGNPQRYFVHGVSYIDERLTMVNTYGTTSTSDDRPYYYVIDRMYNVMFIIDRAGAIVERYAYDPYGKPYIRESLGRGDFYVDTQFWNLDAPDMADAVSATIWDPRGDLDDDGDVDGTDSTLYTAKDTIWPLPSSDQPTVAQAFSDVGNRYMFQGVPHFAFDTSTSATTEKFSMNHHRARFAEPVTGRWVTRDPLDYQYAGASANPELISAEATLISGLFSIGRTNSASNTPAEVNLFGLLANQPCQELDPTGYVPFDFLVPIDYNSMMLCGPCGQFYYEQSRVFVINLITGTRTLIASSISTGCCYDCSAYGVVFSGIAAACGGSCHQIWQGAPQYNQCVTNCIRWAAGCSTCISATGWRSGPWAPLPWWLSIDF